MPNTMWNSVEENAGNLDWVVVIRMWVELLDVKKDI